MAWARERSGYQPEPVAKRLSVKVERFLSWEQGDRQPTVRQVEALAMDWDAPREGGVLT